MTDTTDHLHVKIVAALLADTNVQSVFGNRIYDAVPQDVQTPYIRVGEFLPVRDEAECIDGYEVYYDVHVWTAEGKGLNQCRRLCGVVIEALDNLAIDLPSIAVIENKHRATRAFRDADGRTNHGIVNFRVMTEKV